MLEAEGISSGYGQVTVLHELTFDVRKEVLAVLGANGAGKSTLMWTIARLLPLTSGRLTFDGTDVSGTPAHRLARSGVALVPQESNVFADLTVEENLAVGGQSAGTERSFRDRHDEVMTLFPALHERRHQRAGTLSGGEGQMVAVGRALMQDPRVLLLDEPTAGLAPIYVDSFFERILQIQRTKNIAVVVAEQNAVKAQAIADRVMLLHLGRIATIGDADVKLDVSDIKRGYGL